MKCRLADEDISPLFLGVFPADQIPKFFPGKDWCLVANTDPADKGGQHWIALGSRWNKNFYFDSYGKKPDVYQSYWSRFVKWTGSEKNLQQTTSDVCGDWCLYWCTSFARVSSEKKLEEFIDKFSDNNEANDKHVVHVMHTRFPRILNSTKHSNLLDIVLKKRLESIAYPQCLMNNQCCMSREKKE